VDPLTHTLVGANLASTRLGETTRLATAALVIGANLPDVDAILYFTGHDDFALGFRRGWTHGVLALVVLPFVQTALLMLYARLRRIAVSPRWLLLLSAFAILTHPTLDWLNNYGMRWLMPFRGTWFYGDSVYIMDPWLWLILGCGWLAGRRASPLLIGAWAVVMALLAWVVSGRNTAYLGVVAVVGVLFLAALLWPARRSLSTAALILAASYIAARLAIHQRTVHEVRGRVAGIERLMAAPHPINPLRWDIVAETGDVYRYGRYTWNDRRLTLDPLALPVAKDSPEWRAARADPSIRGFVAWVRFPWYEVERRGSGTIVHVHDARYAVRRGPGGGFGGESVVIK
jgi:inner membrane protein